MRYDDLDYFDITVDDVGIALVRLNRPERGNAYSALDHGQMCVLFSRLEADDTVRVSVITGAGTDFTVGPDQEFARQLLDDPLVARKGMAEVRQLINAALAAEKPIISAVHGRIVGGALAFALLADISIVERDVMLRDIHVPAGIAAGDGGVFVWVQALGLTRAKRYLLTGDPITADDAAQLGLVTEVVDTGHALERAIEYATRFANGPQAAIRETKRALNVAARYGPVAGFELSCDLEEASLGRPDARRGMADLMRGGPGIMPADLPGASSTG